MYAGIQRISATSRKRTRKEARKVRSPACRHASLSSGLTRLGRRTNHRRDRAGGCATSGRPSTPDRKSRRAAPVIPHDFVSLTMLPSSESRPTPGTKLPLRTDRMNVLDSSIGIDATFAQNSSQIPFAPQILFDVGDVERRNDRAVIADVPAHAAKRLRAAEVADDRHEQVLGLELLQQLRSSPRWPGSSGRVPNRPRPS